MTGKLVREPSTFGHKFLEVRSGHHCSIFDPESKWSQHHRFHFYMTCTRYGASHSQSSGIGDELPPVMCLGTLRTPPPPLSPAFGTSYQLKQSLTPIGNISLVNPSTSISSTSAPTTDSIGFQQPPKSCSLHRGAGWHSEPSQSQLPCPRRPQFSSIAASISCRTLRPVDTRLPLAMSLEKL